MTNIDYEAIRALEAVVKEGGFVHAARALHVTQSAVSQRIRTLEDRFGAPLIARGQPPVATKLGNALLAHLRTVTALENELRADIGEQSENVGSTLVIGVNADSLATWFLDAIAPLLTNRNVRLDLIVENEERTVDLLQRGEVFACISSSSAPPTGCEMASLGKMRYVCVATPRFVKTHFPKGFVEAAIPSAPAVLFDRKDWVHSKFLEKNMRWAADYPRHYVPSSEGFVAMIVRGFAYGTAPESQVRHLIERGKLIDLAPGKAVELPLLWIYLRRETAAQKNLRITMIRMAKQLLAG